jgi:hypothetical protein
MPLNVATVGHPITKHCPIITGGDLTLQTILLAENAFNKFFITKNVAKEEKVKLILGTFKDVHIRNWIATDHEQLLELTFREFLGKLHANSLSSNWVETIQISLLGMQMNKNTRFWDYAQKVHAMNIVLHGTPSHLGEAALHNQSEASLKTSLQSECARDELYKLATLKEWIECVWKIGKRLGMERKRYQEIYTEELNLRANKCPALGTSCVPNAPTGSIQPSSSSGQKPFVCLPKLTDGEKNLLWAHAGCFKCRRFNAGHNSSSPHCTSLPSGSGYKPITKYADAAGQPANKPLNPPKTKVVASTIEDVDSDDRDVIAAFAPSAAFRNGMDSGGSDNVSDIAPLKPKHFIWNCIIDSPLLEFPLKVLSLIDNRCHLVLIRPDIIEKLSLIIFFLESPKNIDIAIKDCEKKRKMQLENFVILKAASIDQQWCSKRVCAIITPQSLYASNFWPSLSLP